jgi:hypothetical protein
MKHVDTGLFGAFYFIGEPREVGAKDRRGKFRHGAKVVIWDALGNEKPVGLIGSMGVSTLIRCSSFDSAQDEVV